MQFNFTEDQVAIRDAAREFVAERAGSLQLRAAMEMPLGYDPAVWQALAKDLGWCGLATPESAGGSGLGMVELAILLEESGRHLLGTPFLATAGLSAAVIQECPASAARDALLNAIATDGHRVALAITDDSGLPGRCAVRLVRAGEGLVLSGHASFVLSGNAADSLVVAATADDDSVCIARVAVAAPGVQVTALTGMDLTRRYARVTFDQAKPQALLCDGTGARTSLARGLQVAQVALAAEQMGGAFGALELTSEFCRNRVQFGRPIGSFQAIKHRLADMLVACEAAKSAVYYAACTVDEWRSGLGTPQELAEAAALVKSHCSDTFLSVAGNAIQLHGGIGFTWEYDAHLYFKRARATGNLLGTSQYHRDRIAQLIGLDAAGGGAS